MKVCDRRWKWDRLELNQQADEVTSEVDSMDEKTRSLSKQNAICDFLERNRLMVDRDLQHEELEFTTREVMWEDVSKTIQVTVS